MKGRTLQQSYVRKYLKQQTRILVLALNLEDHYQGDFVFKLSKSVKWLRSKGTRAQAAAWGMDCLQPRDTCMMAPGLGCMRRGPPGQEQASSEGGQEAGQTVEKSLKGRPGWTWRRRVSPLITQCVIQGILEASAWRGSKFTLMKPQLWQPQRATGWTTWPPEVPSGPDCSFNYFKS